MSDSKKNILVTGGAGFIGSNFINYLHRKYPEYKILLLDALTYAGNLDSITNGIKQNGHFQFYHGNVTHPDIVNSLVAKSDMVVHFAAESHVTRSIYDNSIFFETDVIGTQVLANAIVNHPVELFIHISSSEVYGTALKSPMDEDHPLNPMSPYAAAKAGADRLVYSYMQTYDFPAVIVRPFNNYGPCQHLEKAIPNFIVSALQDQPLTLHGSGESSRDWIYVEDTCEALCRIMHADREKVVGETINLGTGIDTSVNAIAKKILNILDLPESRIKYVTDRPGQVSRHISSREKAKRLLNWETSVSLDEGLERTIEFYTRNRKWWDKFLWMQELWGVH
ncbi:MAG: GDP-mannose 4,6-dehydratase [Nitrospinae bacterium]|nr:GDP-mannose 4,6-dehydratase [Nitrospinota bacterium]